MSIGKVPPGEMSMAAAHLSLGTAQSTSTAGVHIEGQKPSDVSEHGRGDEVHVSSQAYVGVILSWYVKTVSWVDCATHPAAVGHLPLPVASGIPNEGAFGSHVSGGSTKPLPHEGMQLLSLRAL